MTTIRRVLTRLTRSHDKQPSVHFHQGPQGVPAPCFERGCGSPKLDV
jgi:hypothetical protein